MPSSGTHYAGAVTCRWANDVVDCDWAGTGAEAAKALALKSMGWGDLLGLFAIIIALSAYLATIRLAAIHLAKTDQENKASFQRKIALITLPDIALVTSALLLGCYMFGSVFNLPRSDRQLSWSIGLFAVAIVLLALYHLGSWLRTADIVFVEWTTGKSIRNRVLDRWKSISQRRGGS